MVPPKIRRGALRPGASYSAEYAHSEGSLIPIRYPFNPYRAARSAYWLGLILGIWQRIALCLIEDHGGHVISLRPPLTFNLITGTDTAHIGSSRPIGSVTYAFFGLRRECQTRAGSRTSAFGPKLHPDMARICARAMFSCLAPKTSRTMRLWRRRIAGATAK